MHPIISVLISIIASVYMGNLLGRYLILEEKVDAISLIEKNGYHSESYWVQTKDGYILKLIRMLKSKGVAPKSSPVLLMHGLSMGPAEWIVGNGDQVFSHILLDMGYDVWIGSARGTFESRNHSFIDVQKNNSFWDFSFHEIGVYDLPAIIDFILLKTKKEDLIYVGFSQGSTSFFIMSSMLPHMNKKIRLFVSWAPAVIFQEHGLFDKTNTIITSSTFLKMLNFLGFHYYMPSDILMRTNEIFCKGKIGTQLACKCLLWLMNSNFNKENIHWKMKMMQYMPQSVSNKQMDHYNQLYTTGKFGQYDYGQEENLSKYGTKDPPEYNLSAVNIPWAIYYSKGDNHISYKDMETLILLTSGAPLRRKFLVSDDRFDHFDFVFSKDVATLLYDDVIDLLKKHTFK